MHSVGTEMGSGIFALRCGRSSAQLSKKTSPHVKGATLGRRCGKGDGWPGDERRWLERWWDGMA